MWAHAFFLEPQDPGGLLLASALVAGLALARGARAPPEELAWALALWVLPAALLVSSLPGEYWDRALVLHPGLVRSVNSQFRDNTSKILRLLRSNEGTRIRSAEGPRSLQTVR